MPDNNWFVREVWKYFMNFLETDFHKTRLPKRNSMSKISKWFKVWIDLDKYIWLKRDFYSIFHKGFEKNTLSIKKGTYTSPIPDSTFRLINSNIKKIDEQRLENAFDEVVMNLKVIRKTHLKNYQLYLEESLNTIQAIFTKSFIVPFLDTIQGPLETLDLVDDNWLYQIEWELSTSLFSLFESMLATMLQQYFESYEYEQLEKVSKDENKKQIYNIKKVLIKNISLDELQSDLEEFFKNISVSDAFDDIYILFKNNKTLDKTELYLYMYEISSWSQSFPLLYIPIKLEEKKSSFDLIFDTKLFVNTKAIDYVVQEHNRKLWSNGTLAGNFERIIYINDDENFIQKVSWIVDSLQNFFKFSRGIDISTHIPEKVEHMISWFSNKSYIYLFDKSDESVINDYEEILQDNEWILPEFTKLLNDFIQSNPVNFEEEISDAWHEKDIWDKLVFESPIPLNDEQKQVVSALWKKDCKVVTIEGPPGTWKSHTITAIICRALLNAQSVLVLSDKKEALDVVEDKITQTLDTIRKDDDFLNPILRLGKSWNKFGKIVQGQTINKIAEHYSAYKYKKKELDEDKATLLESIHSNIDTNVSHYENISLWDIKLYFSLLPNFEGIDFISSPEELSVDLVWLKESIENIGLWEENSVISSKTFAEPHWSSYVKFQSILRDLKEKNTHFQASFSGLGIWDYERDVKLNNKKITAIEQFQKSVGIISDSLDASHISDYFGLTSFRDKSAFDLLNSRVRELLELIEKAQKYNWNSLQKSWTYSHFELDSFSEKTLDSLNQLSLDILWLKKPLIGYLLSKKKLESLFRQVKDIFPYFNAEKLPSATIDIQKITDLIGFLYKGSAEDFLTTWNTLVSFIEEGSTLEDIASHTTKILELYEQYNFIEQWFEPESEIVKCHWFIDITPHILEFDDIRDTMKVLGDRYDYKDYDLVCYTWDEALEWEFHTASILFERYEDIKKIESISQDFPELCERIWLQFDQSNILDVDSNLSSYENRFLEEYHTFSNLAMKIRSQFMTLPEDIFLDGISQVQSQTTAEMAYFLDKRIVEYTRNHAKEVSTLKWIISKKKKFPKGLFENLKNAFPCILAWIRDYSEYIPLEKDLFDLIIIDEASQVSIAQSLPALIRGKKIIILWDDKQFSNVKSDNASKIVNQEYKSKVRKTFIEENLEGKNDDFGWLENVWNFDIKYSILKFSKSIQNYKCQLRKHFRWYPEHISYSNKYFYGGTLQCMKIRGKAIDDILKIDVIPHDGLIDVSRNTNMLEIDFIIERLRSFYDAWIKQSLGIISPHNDQVALLQDKIWELPFKDYLFEDCKLKIMTFDSCQWEERDYIFYSMVASDQKDRLKYIFIKDLASQDIEEDGGVKAQRLNVWFSRAKETMHFVLSKPISEFSWEIKNALLHYQNEIEVWRKVVLEGTDINSPMEKKIQEYFFDTQFYKDNHWDLELIPQFNLWAYLKQLDRTYNHPAYKVDFLVIFNEDKLVIEYDGFKEHFGDLSNVTAENHERYMKADDIYRQKVLEGYGYQFLRINKFNIWEDPVQTLSDRLENVFKKKRVESSSLDSLHDQIDRLQDWDQRACQSCGKILDSVYFPYKTKFECLTCYEKASWKTLWSKRDDIKRFERDKNEDLQLGEPGDYFDMQWLIDLLEDCEQDRFLEYTLKYSKFRVYWDSMKILISENKKYNKLCINEDKIQNMLKQLGINSLEFVEYDENKTTTSSPLSIQEKKVEDNFQRENTIDEILQYLKKRKDSRQDVGIYYKNNQELSTFNTYYFDETYLHVKYGNSPYYIKYLISKIRKVI